MEGQWQFPRFKKEFYTLTGLDLESYKDKQMERRINQLVEREGYGDLRTFFQAVKGSKDVLHKFYNYLTINTSVFYRDSKIYDHLEQKVLVDLLDSFPRLKIWSIGCSHGEEPYSLALILDGLQALKRVEILAGDIDEKALSMAQEGCYVKGQLEKVPPKVLQTAFEVRDGRYYLKPRYKEAVTFRKQNFLTPVYAEMKKLHLALCRNVFIYFKPDIQEWIIEQVSRQLLKGGYFVIGCAEFINNPDRFGLVREIPSIYKKIR